MLNNLPCYSVCRSWKPWHYIQSPATRSFTGGVKVHCDSPCKTGRHIDDGDDDYGSESDIKNNPRLQIVTSTFPFPSILDLRSGFNPLHPISVCIFSILYSILFLYISQDADGENLFNSQELHCSDHFPYFFDLIV